MQTRRTPKKREKKTQERRERERERDRDHVVWQCICDDDMMMMDAPLFWFVTH
jgi:hypothetical protein